MDLSDDPHQHLLHPAEVALASTLRLTCAEYLATKRRLFKAKAELFREGEEDFMKAHARTVTHVDSDKASKLGEAFYRVGWFDDKWFDNVRPKYHGKGGNGDDKASELASC